MAWYYAFWDHQMQNILGWARGCPLTTPKNQDQAMYVRTSFRVQNHAKFEKKLIFVVFTNFGKDIIGKLKEKNMQKRGIRVYFHTWKLRT